MGWKILKHFTERQLWRRQIYEIFSRAIPEGHQKRCDRSAEALSPCLLWKTKHYRQGCYDTAQSCFNLAQRPLTAVKKLPSSPRRAYSTWEQGKWWLYLIHGGFSKALASECSLGFTSMYRDGNCRVGFKFSVGSSMQAVSFRLNIIIISIVN